MAITPTTIRTFLESVVPLLKRLGINPEAIVRVVAKQGLDVLLTTHFLAAYHAITPEEFKDDYSSTSTAVVRGWIRSLMYQGIKRVIVTHLKIPAKFGKVAGFIADWVRDEYDDAVVLSSVPLLRDVTTPEEAVDIVVDNFILALGSKK